MARAQGENVGSKADAARLEARATLTLPSAVSEAGWYWAEELLDSGEDFALRVLEVEAVEGGDELSFCCDGSSYDRGLVDEFFRVIDRIAEPAGYPKGGWR